MKFALHGNGQVFMPENLIYNKDTIFNISGFFQRIDNFLGKFKTFVEAAQERHDKELAELKRARPKLGEAFPQADLLNALRQDNIAVIAELKRMQKDSNYVSAWQPGSEKILSKNKNVKSIEQPEREKIAVVVPVSVQTHAQTGLAI